jgi:type VI secretion system protein ImpG
MIDDLIEYYQRELAFLGDSAGAFADAYPKIAARLGLTREAIEDPHIGRLIEAVAFMNARLRHKLDDEFPELSDALLLTLYPHLIQPVPSFFVARLEPGPDLDKPLLVPRGTVLLTEPVADVACQYRLAADTWLLPLRLAAASMAGPPLDAPPLGLRDDRGRPREAKGVLRLQFAVTKAEVALAGLEIDRLKLFIKSDARRAQLLIEQLGVNLIGIGVGTGPADPRAVLLPPAALRLLGLGDDELLLPQSPVASLAYAAVQEHFSYPQKQLFFEISGLAARTVDIEGSALDLFLYFDRLSPELERVVRADDFELFACPALNLFEAESEPIHIDQTVVEYRIVPDSSAEDAREVHSVLGVSLQDARGDLLAVPPLHAIDRGSARLGRLFHATARRSSFGPGGGDDVFLTVADLDGRLLEDEAAVVSAQLLCTNRDLPARLPFGGGRPWLSLTEVLPGLAGVSALTKPSPTRRPARRRAAVWKLIGQLSLNHLSLVGGSDGAKALREVLALYDIADSADSASLRDRLVGISAQPGVARVRLKGHTAIAAGIEVTLEFDDERLSGSGSFLLCTVIERFLASACAINSFVRVTAQLRGEPEPWKRWTPRIGDRVLL